ncbi:Prepilin peptidase dependent protein A precursor [Dickeya aquatica]|uniref:Type II secretion system protein H n=2 Tax=Pectobacteriaceae TaxID=1903410 RepID=A0A375ADI6_9GAMM|nr:Prepilin peptidase dependent protein A precursor [Dickeya aquatica]
MPLGRFRIAAMSDNNRQQYGFSLTELMLVITVIAMLAGGGLRSWLAYRQSLQLEQHARQLLSVLTAVQTQANWRNQTMALWVQSSADAWCLVLTDAPAHCDAAEKTVYYRYLKEVELLETTSPRLVFYGLRNAAQSGHLTLRSPAGRVRLVISARGRLRLCSEGFSVQGIPIC